MGTCVERLQKRLFRLRQRGVGHVLIAQKQRVASLAQALIAPLAQGFGLGRQIQQQVEGRVRAMGGTRLYAETSGRPQYASTRAFYEHMGFALCELLEDFYAPGDARATYVKPIAPS